MSNRKTFRSAQDQVPVNPSHGARSGFVDIGAVSISLKKTQTRRSDPYKTIIKISERLRIPTKALFFKILRTDTTGNVYLHVMQASASSNALVIVGVEVLKSFWRDIALMNCSICW